MFTILPITDFCLFPLGIHMVLSLLKHQQDANTLSTTYKKFKSYLDDMVVNKKIINRSLEEITTLYNLLTRKSSLI